MWRLPETQQDIKRLHDFLKSKSPGAATRAIRAIQDGAKILTLHPESGKPMGNDTGQRELFVPFGSGAYVLRYRVAGDAVVVVRVWHGREFR